MKPTNGRNYFCVAVLSLTVFFTTFWATGDALDTSFRGLGNITALPHDETILSSSKNETLVLRYGYDAVAKLLAIDISVDFSPFIVETEHSNGTTTKSTITRTPGWIGIGLRTTGLSTSYTTMGPADFVKSYLIPSSRSASGAPEFCMAESFLTTVENFFPTPGKRLGRVWELQDTRSSVTTTNDGHHIMTFQGVITGLGGLFPAPNVTSGWLEALVAVGDANQVSATSCGESLVATAKHNVVAKRLNISIPGEGPVFRLPSHENGCTYGEASVEFANSTRPRCTKCFPDYQGPNCTRRCVCPHGFCINSVHIDTGSCTACDSGFFGPRCQECQCNQEVGGVCQDGVAGNGFCLCRSPYGGPTCDGCDDSHYGPNCSSHCLCLWGTCNNSMTAGGDGRCVSCSDTAAGPFCNISCPDCGAIGQVCDSGIDGTGKCMRVTETPAPSTPVPTLPTIGLSVTMTGEISTFQVDSFKSTVAQAIVVQTSEISVQAVRAGSVIVDFKLTGMDDAIAQQKYDTFIDLADRSDASLHVLRITAITRNRISNTPQPTTGSPPTPEPATSGSGSGSGSNGGEVTNTPGVIGTVSPDLRPVQRKTGLSTPAIIGLVIGLTVLLVAVVAIAGCAIKSASGDTIDLASKTTMPVGEQDDDAASKGSSPPINPNKDGAFGVDRALNGSGGSRGDTPPPGHSHPLGESLTEEDLQRLKEARRRELLGDTSSDEGEAAERFVPSPQKREAPIPSSPASPMEGKKVASPRTATPPPPPASTSPQQVPPAAAAVVAVGGSGSSGAGTPKGATGTTPKAGFSLRRKEPAPAVSAAAAAASGPPSGPASAGTTSGPSSPSAAIPSSTGVGSSTKYLVGQQQQVGGGGSGEKMIRQSDSDRSIEEISDARPSNPPPALPSYAVSIATPTPSDRDTDMEKPRSPVSSMPSPSPKPHESRSSHPRSHHHRQQQQPVVEEQHPNQPPLDLGGHPSVGGGGGGVSSTLEPGGDHLSISRDDFSEGPATDGGKGSKKRCKYCNLLFAEAPSMCTVEGRSHRTLKEERKIEKRAKKDARRRVAAQIATEHANFFVDDSEAD